MPAAAATTRLPPNREQRPTVVDIDIDIGMPIAEMLVLLFAPKTTCR
ncbi:hypothetical protein ABIB90_008177 [Bradyrhizobium sp. JR4.1]